MLGMIKDWYARLKKTGEERGISVGFGDFLKLVIIKLAANNTIADFYDKQLYEGKNFRHYLFHMDGPTWRKAKAKYRPEAGKVWGFFRCFDYCLCRLLYPGIHAKDYFRYEFYNCSHQKRKTFITESHLKRLDRAFNGGLDSNSEAVETLAYKDRFNRVFSAYVGRKWIVSQNITKPAFDAFCEGMEEAIVKPLSGIQGKGVHKMPLRSPEEREALYQEMLSSDVIAEQVLRQHRSIAAINPTSINTIRVFTVRRRDGSILVTDAAFRVGRYGATTDNYHSGGLAFAIDRDTGIVISRGVDKNACSVIIHPDSHVIVLGFQIPGWDKVREACIGAHALIPALGFIGWDVVVLEDGSIELIEGNTAPGVTDLYQYPMLEGRKKAYDDLLK